MKDSTITMPLKDWLTLRASNHRMRNILRLCASQFRYYERIHAAKEPTAESVRKRMANRQMADLCNHTARDDAYVRAELGPPSQDGTPLPPPLSDDSAPTTAYQDFLSTPGVEAYAAQRLYDGWVDAGRPDIWDVRPVFEKSFPTG